MVTRPPAPRSSPLPFCSGPPAPPRPSGRTSSQGLALAGYLGALPTALAYVLFARGLSRIGAGETATLTLAEPVTAMALGFVVLGERPGAAAVAGAALVLAGLAVLALRPEPKLHIRSQPAEAAL